MTHAPGADAWATGTPTTGRLLRIEATGPLTTVQDLGRPGYAHLGVPRSGAADRSALRLANRLVGNHEAAAGLEVTLGGLELTPLADVVLAVTGAACPLTVAGTPSPRNSVLHVEAGARLSLGHARAGLRAYVAVRGGLAVSPVLGSRATDTLSGIGPPRPAAGDLLPVHRCTREWPAVDVAPIADPTAPDGVVTLTAVPGPRDDWLDSSAFAVLVSAAWTVSAHSDRVGLRLDGPPLARSRHDELPSEGLVLGAVQVPASGRPVVFLADHPVTGGYPVAAVLRDADVDRAAQLRPGQQVRLRLQR